MASRTWRQVHDQGTCVCLCTTCDCSEVNMCECNLILSRHGSNESLRHHDSSTNSMTAPSQLSTNFLIIDLLQVGNALGPWSSWCSKQAWLTSTTPIPVTEPARSIHIGKNWSSILLFGHVQCCTSTHTPPQHLPAIAGLPSLHLDLVTALAGRIAARPRRKTHVSEAQTQERSWLNSSMKLRTCCISDSKA